MPSSPTSRDVARTAGVSQSTVSYVLSGKRFVAPETRTRVREAMIELGYRPHASARALKSNRSRILGLIAPYHESTDAPGQYRYIVSLAAACRRHGYELLVISGEEGVEGMHRLTESALCDGILVMDVRDHDARVDAARESRIPSVFIGLSHDANEVVATDTDFEAIGAGCAQRLHDAGHRRALVINPLSEHITPMGFIRRFAQALDERASALGLVLESLEVPRDFRSMRAALSGYLSDAGPADAFIAAPATSIARAKRVSRPAGSASTPRGSPQVRTDIASAASRGPNSCTWAAGRDAAARASATKSSRILMIVRSSKRSRE